MKSKHFDITHEERITHDAVARVETDYLDPSIAIYGLNGSKCFISKRKGLEDLRDAINFALGEGND